MRLRLANVTLCAADCATTALAARALRQSSSYCDFADAILFSDTSVPEEGFRCIRIPRLGSRAAYSTFVLKELAHFVRTDFALVIQWDGYVLEPSAWTTEFLHFDYIGARWHWVKDGMTVGNGGFSLRSRRLLEATAAPQFPMVPGLNEDEQICRAQRQRLTDSGICFAPEALADRFSYERSQPERPTFGFHGLFNVWRHVEDRELIEIATGLPAHIVRSVEFVELVLSQVTLRKFLVIRALYLHWQRSCSASEIRAQLLGVARNHGAVVRLECLFDSLEKP